MDVQELKATYEQQQVVSLAALKAAKEHRAKVAAAMSDLSIPDEEVESLEAEQKRLDKIATHEANAALAAINALRKAERGQ